MSCGERRQGASLPPPDAKAIGGVRLCGMGPFLGAGGGRRWRIFVGARDVRFAPILRPRYVRRSGDHASLSRVDKPRGEDERVKWCWRTLRVNPAYLRSDGRDSCRR